MQYGVRELLCFRKVSMVSVVHMSETIVKMQALKSAHTKYHHVPETWMAKQKEIDTKRKSNLPWQKKVVYKTFSSSKRNTEKKANSSIIGLPKDRVKVWTFAVEDGIGARTVQRVVQKVTNNEVEWEEVWLKIISGFSFQQYLTTQTVFHHASSVSEFCLWRIHVINIDQLLWLSRLKFNVHNRHTKNNNNNTL